MKHKQSIYAFCVILFIAFSTGVINVMIPVFIIAAVVAASLLEVRIVMFAITLVVPVFKDLGAIDLKRECTVLNISVHVMLACVLYLFALFAYDIQEMLYSLFGYLLIGEII